MTSRSLFALLVLALISSSALAQGPKPADPAKQHQESKDPAALKPEMRTLGAGADKAAPGKPAAPPPPTGGEVGTAIDAMAGSCSKALALHTEIAAAAAKVKASNATRQKSNAEMKKRMRAVISAKAKVARAAKKAGSDAAPMADTAKADYEAALAESKTYEVETQNVQATEDQLVQLVAQAEEASAACTKYEEVVRAAAAHAKRAVAEAKKHAAKARQIAAVKAEKARAAARAQQAKELAAAKTETEAARTTLEEVKAEAAKQPATPATPATPASGAAAKKPATPATPAAASEKKPGKPETAGPKPK
jgi:hypothetical protein